MFLLGFELKLQLNLNTLQKQPVQNVEIIKYLRNCAYLVLHKSLVMLD